MSARDAALDLAARRSTTAFGRVDWTLADRRVTAGVIEVVADVIGGMLPGGPDEFWQRVEAQIRGVA